MTKRISTAAARKDFASMVRTTARGHRVKLTRYNKTIAIIIPTADLRALEDCERRSAKARSLRVAGKRG